MTYWWPSTKWLSLILWDIWKTSKQKLSLKNLSIAASALNSAFELLTVSRVSGVFSMVSFELLFSLSSPRCSSAFSLFFSIFFRCALQLWALFFPLFHYCRCIFIHLFLFALINSEIFEKLATTGCPDRIFLRSKIQRIAHKLISMDIIFYLSRMIR